MRSALVDGRHQLVLETGYLDVETASKGRWGPAPENAFDDWDNFHAWADSASASTAATQPTAVRLGPPVPQPRQVFAIALNYREHVAEAGRDVPDAPLVFTKFPSCLTGPYDEIVLPTEHVDFEAELVVVIGRRCDAVTEERAWSHVAGLTAGQDISERVIQRAGSPAQFSLGKSFPGFAPIGPHLVSTDEFGDPDDLELGCSIADGEVLQKGRTSQLIFPVPELIARISRICPLLPGDLIFTGTPPGVGAARQPPRFLVPGEALITHVEGVGEMHNQLIGP